MTVDAADITLLTDAIKALDAGFDDLPPFQATHDHEAMGEVLLAVAERMRDNFPYPHPLYAGQMLKPPHPVARLAYMLAMGINPNNHALDGGRASSIMEKQAVAEIAGMFGWQTHLGHLTSGGTMANLEALWAAGSLHPDKKIVASRQAHYTHQRISKVLRLAFAPVNCDGRARLDVGALETLLESGQVGTVVVTLGSTATGSVDPLPAVLALRERFDFRIHVDAAYGGYFSLVDNLHPETARAYQALDAVDSIVVDPHKHGLQPYGCGCVMFRDPTVGALYKHDSPYTYFSSDELHLGEISLECSRAGASAVALWATQRLLPLTRGGEFAQGLARCREAALELAARIQADSRFMLALEPELDIVVWAPRLASASQVSKASRRLFEAAAGQGLHLAVASFPASLLQQRWPELHWDQPQVACLRSCLMKPEHRDWLEAIWRILDEVTPGVISAVEQPSGS